MSKTTVLPVQMTAEMHKALKAMSGDTGAAMSYLAREAFARYLIDRRSVDLIDVHPSWGGNRQS